MTKHLLLNASGENWRLADQTDLDGLRKTIEAGMQADEVLQLPVYLPDRPDAPVTLLLNCRAVPTVALVEL
jgi:hypothetical protein